MKYQDVEDLETVYFKTQTAGEDALAEEFFTEDYAVVHYCDFPASFDKSEIKCDSKTSIEYDDSLDEDDIDRWIDDRRKLKNKISHINQWAKEGAVVGVENGSVNGEGVLLGYIPPIENAQAPPTHLLICTETSIEADVPVSPSDTWDDIFQRRDQYTARQRQVLEELEEHRSQGLGGYHETYNVFPALKLKDTTWAWYRNHPPLHAYRKQGTCHRWKQNRNYLRLALAGGGNFRSNHSSTSEADEQLHKEVHLLSDGQLEMLCAEYLRREIADVFVQELPVGRSRSTVDITGYDPTNEKLYLAQVTFEDSGSNLEEKITKLEQFSAGSRVDDTIEVETWLFSASTEEVIRSEFSDNPSVEEIGQYTSITDPYSWATQTQEESNDWEEGRKALIERMLTVPDPRPTSDPQTN